MKVFLCQHEIEWEDAAATCARVKTLLPESGIPPGSLIVLPEMFPTGFSFNFARTLEGTARRGETLLSELAGRHESFTVGGVTNRAASGKGSNESIAFGPGGRELARYRKTFPFTPGGESAACEAGDGSHVFDLGGWKTALFICYDLRFPEVFRRPAAAGAELMIVIASWPEVRVNHWVTLLQARAIENQCWVIGVNRAGRDPHFTYPGRSMIVSPQGTIETDAGLHECVARGELHHDPMNSYRAKLPFLSDLRPGFLGL